MQFRSYEIKSRLRFNQSFKYLWKFKMERFIVKLDPWTPLYIQLWKAKDPGWEVEVDYIYTFNELMAFLHW